MEGHTLDLSTEVFVLLVLAALVAGFVDAVVGGGGLIQLPALLVALPGAAPVQLLATNKLASICGTTVSSATYARRIRPDPRTFLPLMAAAFLGSAGGAAVASLVPREAFDPIVLVALVLVGAYVVLKPSLGEVTELRFAGRHHTTAALGTGLVVGFYDGVLGPGTGSFFVFALVGLLGYSFLEASAKAKLANWATNLAALVVFVPQGAVMWGVGLAMGLANMAGGYLGARTAIGRGAAFVRVFFLVVVGGFVVRIGGDLLGLWG
ncbi:TSUP family transporter [Nocardioides solisilvae]|uniref:TSUP family transporter n=1 Tax=Nocardioides solisilvae TaxID=1542435 RepID=UPI001EF3E573|nr:TSUP family transporter [Nocardioides solisilvae]